MCIIRVGYYYTRTPVGTSHMFRKGPFMQHHQPSTSSLSPYHSYKLCLLTNRTAGSPAVALCKNRPIQALTTDWWPAGSTSGENASAARHLKPSIQKTNHCGGWPSGWWKFLLHLRPWSPRGNHSLRLWKSRSPCRHSGDSVSAGDRSFGPGSYWDGWRGAVVLLLDPCQRTQLNQPWRGSRSHQGSPVQQGSGPERYPK